MKDKGECILVTVSTSMCLTGCPCEMYPQNAYFQYDTMHVFTVFLLYPQ